MDSLQWVSLLQQIIMLDYYSVGIYVSVNECVVSPEKMLPVGV